MFPFRIFTSPYACLKHFSFKISHVKLVKQDDIHLKTDYKHNNNSVYEWIKVDKWQHQKDNKCPKLCKNHIFSIIKNIILVVFFIHFIIFLNFCHAFTYWPFLHVRLVTSRSICIEERKKSSYFLWEKQDLTCLTNAMMMLQLRRNNNDFVARVCISLGHFLVIFSGFCYYYYLYVLKRIWIRDAVQLNRI